jgi:hypothetical protein
MSALLVINNNGFQLCTTNVDEETLRFEHKQNQYTHPYCYHLGTWSDEGIQ